MKRWYAFPAILLVLTISCSISSVAGDDTSLSLVTISGDTSIVSLDGSGTYQCLLKNVDPNATVTTDINTSTVSLENVLPAETSIAAIVSADGKNETVFIARLSKPEYSADKKTISWSIIPQQFYDGTLLKEFSEKKSELKPGKHDRTSVNLEYQIPVVNNTK